MTLHPSHQPCKKRKEHRHQHEGNTKARRICGEQDDPFCGIGGIGGKREDCAQNGAQTGRPAKGKGQPQNIGTKGRTTAVPPRDPRFPVQKANADDAKEMRSKHHDQNARPADKPILIGQKQSAKT